MLDKILKTFTKTIAKLEDYVEDETLAKGKKLSEIFDLKQGVKKHEDQITRANAIAAKLKDLVA